ncbi:MAG: hypothetical protein K8F91_12555 [Candidatus Obscuribacterales bacterium]|nr:hypothetical protein [Candidatus Obscuribacterales bacterium]
MKIMQRCLELVEKILGNSNNDQQERIESARITATRLDALKRIRENSNVPDYKLEKEEPPVPVRKTRVDDISLTFGID